MFQSLSKPFFATQLDFFLGQISNKKAPTLRFFIAIPSPTYIKKPFYLKGLNVKIVFWLKHQMRDNCSIVAYLWLCHHYSKRF
jgi:hypothetical protein